MADSAFDIVCKVDLQEVKNAIQHAMKEIVNRFDFKGSGTDIKLIDDGAAIELTSSDEYKIGSAREVLETRLVKRGIALKALDYGKVESALGGTARQKSRFKAVSRPTKLAKSSRSSRAPSAKSRWPFRGIRFALPARRRTTCSRSWAS